MPTGTDKEEVIPMSQTTSSFLQILLVMLIFMLASGMAASLNF